MNVLVDYIIVHARLLVFLLHTTNKDSYVGLRPQHVIGTKSPAMQLTET